MPSLLSPPCRLVLAVISFLGFVTVYMLRINLSVALVSMVNSTDSDINGTHDGQVCPSRQPMANGSASSSASGEFNWDEQTQGYILGAFFCGYILSQIPGGFAAEIYGPKWIFASGVLSTSVLTLLTPIVARWSLPALICLRVLEGVGEGVTFPSMYALLSRWAPPMERTVMTVFIISGSYFGTVIGLPISGYLCDSSLFGGWPAVFYLFGAAGCVWFLFWCVLAYSSPQQHPRISQEECEYIVNSLRNQVTLHNSGVSHLQQLPILQMMASPPVLSLIIAHMSFNWTFYMMLTCLPTYMSKILAIPIAEDSLLSSLPYLSLSIVSNAASLATDFTRKRRWLSTTFLRKANTAIGLLASAIGLTILGHIGCDATVATVCLVAFVGLSGVAISGFNSNHLDLAPQFAGTLLGITNTMATIPGMLAPIVVGAFTNNASTQANWLKVFYLSAGINTFGAVCYLLFGSGNLQVWAVTQQSLIHSCDSGDECDCCDGDEVVSEPVNS